MVALPQICKISTVCMQNRHQMHTKSLQVAASCRRAPVEKAGFWRLAQVGETHGLATLVRLDLNFDCLYESQKIYKQYTNIYKHRYPNICKIHKTNTKYQAAAGPAKTRLKPGTAIYLHGDIFFSVGPEDILIWMKNQLEGRLMLKSWMMGEGERLEKQ